MSATARSHRTSPDWDDLFSIAQAQMGYFTTRQAAVAGYSSPLLHKYLENGKVTRVRRGIYRLVHFPASDHENLVVPWLWTHRVGVFSHQTALTLHDLSDAMPSKVHMTLPLAWRRRRRRMPDGLALYYADLCDDEVASFAAVSVTSPLRTLRDCVEANVSPDLVRQAVAQARQRGLISAREETSLWTALDHAAEGSA